MERDRKMVWSISGGVFTIGEPLGALCAGFGGTRVEVAGVSDGIMRGGIRALARRRGRCCDMVEAD
jgi:hypothetical protein